MYILLITFMVSTQFNIDTNLKSIEFDSKKACQIGADKFQKANEKIPDSKIITVCVPKK